MSWPQIKNIVVLKFHFLLFCAATTNCFLIGLWCGTKSEFYMTTSNDGSVIGPEEASKHFPKPNLHRKRSWSLFGGLLLVWSITAFWILVKPLHLWSMLSKSMRHSENCNTCSQHWSRKRAQFFSTTHNHTSKVEQIELWGFASSAIFTWPLTNYHFFKHLDNFLQAKSTTSRMQKMLFKNSSNPETLIFMLQE